VAGDEGGERVARVGQRDAGVADAPELRDRMPDRFDRLALETKWSIVPLLTTRARFDPGAQPWQDFAALVGLRNAFVHYKSDGRVPGVWKRLQDRGLAAQVSYDGQEHQVMSCCTFDVGVWALATVRAMFSELARILGKDVDSTWSWGERYYWPHEPYGVPE
jgi:hypothetical protein